MNIQQLKEKGRILGFLTSVSTIVGVAKTTFLMARIGEDFEPGELMSVTFGSAFVMVFGGYAIFVNRAGLTEQLISYGFDIRSIFSWSSAEDETDWADLLAHTYKPGRRKYALPIGTNETGKLVEIPMKNSESHLIFSGITGTGKSVLVNQLMLAAAMSGLYQVVVVSLSKKDYQLLDHMKNVHIFSLDNQKFETEEDRYRAYSDLLLTTLGDFNEEVVRRQGVITRYGKRDLHEVRADQRPPAAILILEEFTNALEFAGFGESRARKSAARGALIDAVQVAVNFGRSSMMHLCLIGQRPSGVIPSGVRKQSVNITTRVADASEASLATGRSKSGAETLRIFNSRTGEPGQALIVGSLTNQIVEIPYSPDELISELSYLHEDDVRFAGHPTWISNFKSPRNREVTVTVPLSAPATKKPVTAVTRTAGSVSNHTSTSEESEIFEPVTPAKPSLTTNAVIQIFNRHYEQLQAKNPAPPTLEQFLALGLFAAAGLPYKKLAGPAIFNGTHGDHYDSAHYSQKVIKALAGKFDTNTLQTQLRYLTKFFYQGFPLLDTPKALSISRWVGLGLCVHSQLAQNKSVKAIFGAKNGRYVAYFKKAQEFYKLYELSNQVVS